MKVSELFAEATRHHQAGRLAEAEAGYRRVLQVEPLHAQALGLLGMAAQQGGRNEAAADLLMRAIAVDGSIPYLHNNLGGVLMALGRADDARLAFERALALDGGNLKARFNLGVVLQALQRFDEAAACYRAVLRLQPAYAEAHNNLGTVLRKQRRLEEAVLSFRNAIAAAPQQPDAHGNLGGALFELERTDEAIDAFRRAVALKPDFAEAFYALGLAQQKRRRFDDAVRSFQQAVDLRPDYAEALSELSFTLRQLCDWPLSGAIEPEILRLVRAGTPGIFPFMLLSLDSTPADQLRCAEAYLAHVGVVAGPARPPPARHDRIRVAYLSADFREHAVAHLIAGLFESHDRCRFEITGISCGPADSSPLRRRLEAGVDRFVEARDWSDDQIAAKIAEGGIDVAVDLTGLTTYGRLSSLASRPAPVQTAYLGYPGTTGASFIDYVLVDRFIVPPEAEPFYSEAPVFLPDSYQVNDRKRQIADMTPSRAACGLPDDGFVFACFNNSYKLNPGMLDIWTRLLAAMPGSVLWLLHDNDRAVANLRREAGRRGVAPDRLVFAPRLPAPEHLARHHRADLFLDTRPYNGHTTVSDALWAGLPAVTVAGTTFAGRVAGSLLHAVGLPELVADTTAAYEQLALELARQPAALAGIRAKLLRNRDTAPLFDTDRFRRHIESAYVTMYERRLAGEPPRSFAVPPL